MNEGTHPPARSRRRLIFVGLVGLALFGAGMLATSRFLSKSAPSMISHAPKQGKPKRLAQEKSPYLLQHANNPVDWYPWGPEAFEKARKEDKPIFLSIGYSTCHWCHVMEHESFENPDLAAMLNKYFVAVKVDREERPDLDQIYMAATQAMTGSGGWPMSVWLNHDLKPFYCGTYFPPDSRMGHPGFADVLQRIHEAWTTSRAKIEESCNRMTEALREHMDAKSNDTSIPADGPTQAYRYFERNFDALQGGFGGAPKFPRAVQFPFLFRYHAVTGNPHALNMALFTLQKMARGGMHDQLGGGFARYSVDEEWRVPHFEKMLYDNAQLLSSYTDAWQITHDDAWERVARDIIRYIERDMTSPGGAFYSAEDADSEGVEGTFYVWTEEQVTSLLGEDSAKVVGAHYDFKPGGNFEHNKNVLHGIHTIEETARTTGKNEDQVRKILSEARTKLFDARAKRPRPHLDDKILTGWNGLMISALARAGRAFGEKEFIERAAAAADFALTHLRDPKTGQLYRRYRDGEAKGEGFLDDYAFLTAGILDLFEASQDPRWLEDAIRTNEVMLKRFWDEKHGGFFFAGPEDSTLLLRAKSDFEGAEPSGNSVAALNLLRLSQLANQPELRVKAEKTLHAFAPKITEFAASMPMMLCAFMDSQTKPLQLVIAGNPGVEDTQALWREVNRRYLPNAILLSANGGPHQTKLAHRLPFLEGMKPVGGKAAAYLCRDFTCQAPITRPEVLGQALQPKPKE